jgi:DNA-directed RNA polymerase beta' subunit
MKEVDAKKVDYILDSAVGMFDTSANSIPFLDSIQGNRGLTASKMQEQALSLDTRDKPLFNILDKNGFSIGETLGSAMAAPKAPVSGKVTELTPDMVTVTDSKGKKHEIGLYNNFSLNSESFLHNEPKVKVGDSVKPGQLLADNNFTRDGQVSLGANLKVAYMPYLGYNFEDSAIMSESAAKKLTSNHMDDFKAKRSTNGVFSKNKFQAYYPEEVDKKKLNKLDKDGIIRVGQKVGRDDILIAHMEPKVPTADDLALGRLDKQLKRDMENNSVVWDKDYVGTVTGVEKHGNSVIVNVKTKRPLKEADKISGLHGNKHIISKIVPDHEMPYNPKTGEYMDMTMNPIGVSNRINTSQLLENLAGKIANKTGKQYQITNFDGVDNSRKLMEDAKAARVSDKDTLINPQTGKPFKNKVANGISHILKLEHVVDHKFSARYKDGYDANEQAVSGGHTGGKNLGRMEMSALLARGAKHNLKEMFQIKGQRNDEYWRAMELGDSLPPPKDAFVWDKMMGMMAGAGINVEQKGKTFKLKPMTDEEILGRSRGEIKKPTLTYRKKDLAPMKEGLFDPVKAGGMQGEHYTHFKLPEKVLNPITASAAANLVDKPLKELEDIITGKQFVDRYGNTVAGGSKGAISGGPAVERLLGKVNVDFQLEQAQKQVVRTKNPSEMNKLHKKIRTLKQLKENNMKPTDYMMENVLVTPSKFRPMFSMGTDKTVIMSDINDLYQQTAHTVDAMKGYRSELRNTIKNSDVENMLLAESRGALYNDVKAIAGLGEPTSYLHKVKDKKGFITQIDGGKKKQTKEGFFQNKVLERRQDLVGRSTLILNPTLGGNELGIPEKMATEIFQPFIMQKIVGWGYSPLEAQKQIKDQTDVFKRARQVVADERPVIANRAPSLHRWNMTAFKPVLTKGKSVEVPGVVITRNFGGDYDGDCAVGSTKIVVTKGFVSEFKSGKYSKNKICFGNSELDSSNSKSYIDSTSDLEKFLESRVVSMPANENIPVLLNDGDSVIHVNMEDIPYIESTKVVKDNGNEEYDVPDGMFVLTLDNNTHKFVKAKITKYSIHKNLSNYFISASDGNSLHLSSDESAIAINTVNWNLERVTPEDLKVGKMMAKVTNIDVEGDMNSYNLDNSQTKGSTVPCIDSMPLNLDTGWVIGAIIGDGWASVAKGKNNINISTTHSNIADDFTRILDDLLVKPIPCTMVESPHTFDGYNCVSYKYTKSSSSLARNFKQLIGSGASNKHLPPFFLSSNYDFRIGLLSGLIDTDGTCTYTSTSKKSKRGFNLMYSTTSSRLASEVVLLCRSLGVTASIGEYEYSKSGWKESKIEYRIILSTLKAHKLDLNLRNQDKKSAWIEFKNSNLETSATSIKQDLVPFSADMFLQCKELVHYKNNKKEYSALSDTKRRNYHYISRHYAKKIIELDVNKTLDSRWVEIVNNENVTWVYASKVSLNKKRITMYDVTAPGPYTFMCANGIIVQDTFQIHTPVGKEAVKEAWNMMPSSSMLKTGYDSVLNAPAMDMVVGAWLASKGKGGEDTNHSFSDIDEARSAFKSNKFSHGDKVTIGGRKATFGMHEINSAAPDDDKRWDYELNANNVDDWIKSVTKKHNGKMALGLADKIGQVGNRYVTDFGYTLGVSDTLSDKTIREPLIAAAKAKSNPRDKMSVIKSYADAKSEGERQLKKKHGDKTMLGISIASGGGKGIGNTAAITMMPGIVMDADDKPIDMPITQSYSEGLDSFGYWAAAHGARGGNIKKSVSSFKPGWLTKDLMNSIYDTVITGDKPVDTEGLEYNIDDKKNIMNRYLARDVKDSKGEIVVKRNDLVTSDVINKMNQRGIKNMFLQSPITDPSEGDGFSAWSYGTDYAGKKHNVGDNIGVVSAHTITEPSLNLAMKSFHTGGAFEGGKKGKAKGTVFDRLDRTLRFTKNIPDKATLASIDGQVKSINKSSIGGYDVVLQNKDKEETRYVEPGLDLSVKRGDVVKMGDRLSEGTKSVHDILKYKGMREAQKFLVDEIDDINSNKLDRRDIETIVRGITNTTRIMNPGSAKNYTAGDVAPLSSIQAYNRNNLKEEDIENAIDDHFAQDYGKFKKGEKINSRKVQELDKMGMKRISVFKDRIKHEPFLTPAGIAAKAAASEDWIARLSHNRIRQVLQEGTTQGWKSDVLKNHPIPAYVTGEYSW